MTTQKQQWQDNEETQREAAEAFNAVQLFGINQGVYIPQGIIEAMDYVSDYLGDIAMGRKVSIESPSDAMPTLLAEEIEKAREGERERIISDIEDFYAGTDECSQIISIIKI